MVIISGPGVLQEEIIRSEQDIAQLVELYVASFSGRIQQERPIVEKGARRTIIHSLHDGNILLAYDGATAVGFLMFEALYGIHAIMFDALLFHRHNTERGAQDTVDLVQRIARESAYSDGTRMNPSSIEASKIEVITGTDALTVQGRDEKDWGKTATAVHADYKKGGIATALNDRLTTAALHYKIPHIFTVCTDDRGILEMNRKAGYQEIAMIKPWYADRSSATFMVKDLTEARREL